MNSQSLAAEFANRTSGFWSYMTREALAEWVVRADGHGDSAQPNQVQHECGVGGGHGGMGVAVDASEGRDLDAWATGQPEDGERVIPPGTSGLEVRCSMNTKSASASRISRPESGSPAARRFSRPTGLLRR